MKALVLNGALAGDEGLKPIEQSVAAVLATRGCEVEHIVLRTLTIAYCKGCFNCWTKTPGACQTHDAAPAVTRSVARSDLLVVLSPVTFGGYSSEIKKVLDRSIGIVSPLFQKIDGETHHRRRYARYPALVAVGVIDEHDDEEERIFTTLVARNAINIHAPAHAAAVVLRSEPPEQILSVVGRLIGQVAGALKGAA